MGLNKLGVEKHLIEVEILKYQIKNILAKGTSDWDFGSNNLTTTGSVIADKINIDNIGEKTTGHGIVFDNALDVQTNTIKSTDSKFRFSYIDGTTKDFVYNLANEGFSQDITSDVLDLGTSSSKWRDIYYSGSIFGGAISGTNSNWDAAFTHVSSDGSDHGFINQSVITTANPTFRSLTLGSDITCKDVIAEDFSGTSLKLTGAGTASSFTATGTVQGEHLRSTDDAVIDDNLTVDNHVGIGTTAGTNVWEVLNMEFTRANNFGGWYVENLSADGITRFSVGMDHLDGTKGVLFQYDNEDGRALILNRKATVGTMEFITTGGGVKVLNDGGVEMLPVYSDIISSNVRDLQIDDAGRLGFVSSSLRYKKNIRNLTGTENIYNLRPVMFDRKDGTAVDEIGLIAEEVESVMPEIISYKTNKIWEERELAPEDFYNCLIRYEQTNIPETINYSRLVIPLLKEVQNLKARIEVLENIK